MEDREQHIIAEAGKVFMRLGIRSVNMDDIAQHLRISKKTLYQYVKDKNELVLKAVKGITDHHRECILGICAQERNAIDESFEITRFVASQVGQLHPSVHFDLQKYHPESWDVLQSAERADIYKCITDNLRKGIEEGLYREDLDIDVIARIYISRFDVTFDGELFPSDKYRFEDVIWELFRYHIRGIASDKGRKYLVKKVKKERDGGSVAKGAHAALRGLAVAAAAGLGLTLMAQGPMDLSVRQAMDLAAKQSYAVRSSALEAEKARHRVKEITAIGFPQINGELALNNFIDVPTQLVPNFFDPGSSVEYFPAQFSLPWNAVAGLSLNQLIFDGSYIIGLQATKAVAQQSREELELTQAEARVQAARAYYGVLAAEEGVRLAAEGIPLIEQSQREAQAMLDAGFMESTDVDRITIQLEQVRSQQRAFQQQADVARMLLALTLGVPQGTPLRLTSDLPSILADPDETALSEQTFSPEAHVEQRAAETLVRLQTLNMRNERAKALPSLAGFISHRQEWNGPAFDPGGTYPFYPATVWGLRMEVPIISSGSRYHKVRQAEHQLQQVEVNRTATEQRLITEVERARAQARTARDNYADAERNMRLARSIMERTTIKFTNGAATSFELTQERANDLAVQQTYVQRLVDLLIARAELRRALDRY
ncbi:MAG: TolC family protein [Flavobacteriales bacterium]|nr:TolC family protein [Flavobacteriales bacterium]